VHAGEVVRAAVPIVPSEVRRAHERHCKRDDDEVSPTARSVRDAGRDPKKDSCSRPQPTAIKKT
jgi:hypothetical protein